MLNQKHPMPLTGASLDTLKLLAMVFMVLDHVNFVCLGETEDWMFYLGRGALPLFAFAMAGHLYRQVPLDRYLQRLLVFAVLSQPVFVLAFDENALNIIFTLALGTVMAQWVVRQVSWRRHLLFAVALSSVFLEDAIDFDLLGIALPGAFLGALQGQRFARLWTVVILLLLNFEVGDVAGLENGQMIFYGFSLDSLLMVASTIVVPWVSYVICRRVPGGRFLPRYTFYWFYPGHLLLLVIWRLLHGDLSYELFAF